MSSTVWSTDTVNDVAESLGIAGLAPDVVRSLAPDIEYRIYEVVQEAQKFTRHAKRVVLNAGDISRALRLLNIEPMYGYSSNEPVQFREAHLSSSAQQSQQPSLYFVDDDEVDFERIINQPLPRVPRDVSLTAHWLAIEGVQPEIPQNPPRNELDAQTHAAGRQEKGIKPAASWQDGVQVRPMVKHVLSKELQLYFEKLANTLMNTENEGLRNAGVESVRTEPCFHQLLPYMVHFVSEKVTHHLRDPVVLTTMLRVIWALLNNDRLFVEPYLHQIMPSVLTCLVAKRIGSADSAISEHIAVRDLACSVLKYLCDKYGSTYHTLKPRVTRTLLKTFLDNKKPLGTHYGAIIGLTCMGREVVRVLLVPNLKPFVEILLKGPLTSDTETPQVKYDAEHCFSAIMNCELLPATNSTSNDQTVSDKTLREKFGDTLAKAIMDSTTT